MIKLPEQFEFLRDRQRPLDEKVGASLARWASGKERAKSEPKEERQFEAHDSGPESASADEQTDEPTREDPEAPNEPTAAEVSVAKVIEEMKGAKTSAALEKIIKGTEQHRAFMPDDCQIKLDIAISQERQRFEQELVK